MKFEIFRGFLHIAIYNSRNLLMKFEELNEDRERTIYNSRNLLMKFEKTFTISGILSTTVEIY